MTSKVISVKFPEILCTRERGERERERERGREEGREREGERAKYTLRNRGEVTNNRFKPFNVSLRLIPYVMTEKKRSLLE